jgi:next-to-BRCA1 protein 1
MAGFSRSMSVSQRPAVPPPMKSSVSFQMPMDVDTMLTESSCRSDAYGRPQHPVPQHHQAPYVCCPVSQGKAEIKSMLRNFQADLNRVMTNNFDESLLSTSSKPVSQVDVGPTSSPPPFLCSLCVQRREGTWYSCDNCHVVVVRIFITCNLA